MADVKVGWIGTGVMGRSMCGHLLKGGYKATVYTRSQEKARDLLAAALRWARNPCDVAQRSDVIFTMVGFPADVEQVYLAEDGILAGTRSGAILCDMTTSEPSLAVRIHGEARKKSAASVDAPVSGGDVGAREAKLAIMAGGEKAAFEALLPLLRKMGETITLMGGPGAGQHTKMANQIVITGNMIGMVEALLYTQKAGLGLDAMIDIVGKGAAASWSLNNLGRRIARGDFNPGLLHQALREGHGDRAGRGAAHEPFSARPGACEPALHLGAGPWDGEPGNPGVVQGRCRHERRSVTAQE